jgi:alkylation response protein AidB-like acyl-CoA dehydrogenase
MHFAFSEDQLLFRDTVRSIFENECPPAAVRAAWEDGTGDVPGLWTTLAETGVIGLTAPEEFGGLGMGEIDLVMLLEESGRAAIPGPFAEHTAVALPALAEAGSVAASTIEGAASGELVLTAGIGGAEYVVGADLAGALVMQHGDELQLVGSGDVSLDLQESIDRTRHLARVGWDDAAATRLTGADPLRAFDRGAMAAAAQCVGLAQHLVDATVEYVSERYQFGKPVGTYQAVKHHLANAALQVEFARPAVYQAAWAIAADDSNRGREVSLAKALASDAVDNACRTALQCHGAIGYTFEYDLQMWMKRGWALSAAWGDAAWHRDRIGVALGI